jgi:LysM repeat protein
VNVDKLKVDNSLRGNNLYVGQILTVRSNVPLQAQSRPTGPRRSTWVEESEGAPIFYTVQRGDTVSGIAEKYNVTQTQLRELNNLSGNSIRAGQKLRVGTGPAQAPSKGGPAGTGGEYVVKAGDTLGAIALSHGMSVDNLRSLNNLSGNNIRTGQKLRVSVSAAAQAAVPASTTSYVVQPGDTVSVIANKFGMKTADFKALNGLSSDTIRPGQTLKVPGQPQAPAPAQTPVQDQTPVQAAAAGPSGGRGTPSATPQGGTVIYVVQPGDTVSVIANSHGMKTADFKALNGLSSDSIKPGQQLKVRVGDDQQGAQPGLPGAQPSAPQAAAAPSRTTPAQPQAGAGSLAGAQAGVYVVQPGDTVSVIAENHGMKTADFKVLNGLTSDSIRPGQKLKVPTPAGQSTRTTQSSPTGDSAGVTSSVPSRAPTAAAATPTSPAAPSGDGVYVVQPGDSLSVIAENHGMKTADLRALNGMSSDNIRIGQKLQVKGGPAAGAAAPSSPSPPSAPAAPPARTGQSAGSVYEVQPGDTLSVIAEKFGMKTADLRTLNGLSSDSIRPGQKLKVSGSPGGASTTQAPTTQNQAKPAAQTPTTQGQAKPAVQAPVNPAQPLNPQALVAPTSLPLVLPSSTPNSAAPSKPSGGQDTSGSGGIYVVQPGDTISVIADKVGMKTADLKALNGLTSDTIKPGQKLKTK